MSEPPSAQPAPASAEARPPGAGVLLEARGLRKSFGHHQVLHDVDLTVQQGEVVVVIGPSGSGKSTLLRCINFIAPPDGGTIWFDGRWWSAPRPSRLNPFAGRAAERELTRLRAEVGMVFQHFNVFPHLTACQNVTLGLTRVSRLPKAQAEARAHERLERVGLGAKLHEYPERLSGGQKQRVAIARALALDPKLMLFDEATSALDPELIGGILEEMRKLAAAGMTMLVVTHEIGFALEVADRMIFMDHGRVVEEGTPAQFRNPTRERTRAFLNAIVK